jgi:hypothetical protein
VIPAEMDPAFAAGLRTALVEHVHAAPVARRRRRARIGLGLFLGAALAGGGVATAQALLTPPGGEEVRRLGEPVTVTHTGTATVDLGPRPEGADHIELKLTCLTAGMFTFPDGAAVGCDDADVDRDGNFAGYEVELLPGEHMTRITTEPGSRWTLTATYANVRTTDWGVNDTGHTYGASNDRGDPDLVPVFATNGRTGYAYNRDLNEPSPTSPKEAVAWSNAPLVTVHIPVYQSDGKTLVGEFLTQRSALAQAAAEAGHPPNMPMMATAAPRSPVTR